MSEPCAVPGCTDEAEPSCYGICEPHRREELALIHLEEELNIIQIDADLRAQTDADMRQVVKWLRRFDDGVGTAYGRQALSNACLTLANTAPGQRNQQLNAKAYGIGRLVGGGEIDAGKAEKCLLEIAMATGLPRLYALDTIHRALQAGIVNPRIVRDG